MKASYQCSCEPGYHLISDNHTCKAYNGDASHSDDPPALLFANAKDVKLVYLDTEDPSQDVEIQGNLTFWPTKKNCLRILPKIIYSWNS